MSRFLAFVLAATTAVSVWAATDLTVRDIPYSVKTDAYSADKA